MKMKKIFLCVFCGLALVACQSATMSPTGDGNTQSATVNREVNPNVAASVAVGGTQAESGQAGIDTTGQNGTATQ